MSEYIQFGPVTKHVDGIEYDVSSEYEIVKKGENAKLKARNEEIEEDLWINENKVAELAYVLHRIKRYSETADVSEWKIDKVISDIISFDWKKELHLKKEQGK